MPKSKREKIVSLTKTKSRGKEGKNQLIENLRECLEKYTHLYVIDLRNVRNNFLKDVRSEWSSSRFFFGKNNVMKHALGKTEEDEVQPKLHLVSECITGNCGLFFTSEPADIVLKWFSDYEKSGFAKSGFEATETVELKAGPLTQFVHSMETYLRNKIGMPTILKNGVIMLERDFVVSKKGEAITPAQAQLLKLLGVEMSTFSLALSCVWSDGKFKKFETKYKAQDREKEQARRKKVIIDMEERKVLYKKQQQQRMDQWKADSEWRKSVGCPDDKDEDFLVVEECVEEVLEVKEEVLE